MGACNWTMLEGFQLETAVYMRIWFLTVNVSTLCNSTDCCLQASFHVQRCVAGRFILLRIPRGHRKLETQEKHHEGIFEKDMRMTECWFEREGGVCYLNYSPTSPLANIPSHHLRYRKCLGKQKLGNKKAFFRLQISRKRLHFGV